MEAIHTDPKFNDDDAAREHLEALRWPHGSVCPHCGGADRQSKLDGTSHRPGLYFCGHCRQQYTVTVGTVFERSKVPLHKWVYASHLMCASKKGISSKQLERMLGVTYKTAWFMAHRIREAMNIEPTGPLGVNGPVEVDETYWGNVGKQRPGARGGDHKMKIVSIVDREGEKRSFHWRLHAHTDNTNTPFKPRHGPNGRPHAWLYKSPQQGSPAKPKAKDSRKQPRPPKPFPAK